jgi:hypothetical protein
MDSRQAGPMAAGMLAGHYDDVDGLSAAAEEAGCPRAIAARSWSPAWCASGAQAAKEDAQELRDIAQGQGSATEKATAAAQAIREPGAHQADPPDA